MRVCSFLVLCAGIVTATKIATKDDLNFNVDNRLTSHYLLFSQNWLKTARCAFHNSPWQRSKRSICLGTWRTSSKRIGIVGSGDFWSNADAGRIRRRSNELSIWRQSSRGYWRLLFGCLPWAGHPSWSGTTIFAFPIHLPSSFKSVVLSAFDQAFTPLPKHKFQGHADHFASWLAKECQSAGRILCE